MESGETADKQRIREAVWSRLEESGEALFPGAHGRIPNFRGAATAADRLAKTPEWRRARTIKCNPDAPQRPVRFRALREGKTVYMAVPRLRDKKCFWKLDHPRDLPHIDLVVAGSVAVNRSGARIGKGGGYSDLEYAIGREFDAIDGSTRIATTVHALQVLEVDLPVTDHDFFLDLIATPEELLRPRRGKRRPSRGVIPEHLTAEIRRDVPVLADLELR